MYCLNDAACRINLDRKHGGLGGLSYPLLSDFNKSISRDYDVLIEKEGIALRGLFLIDPQGVMRQITVNDLPVGRSVDETLRLLKAFQFVEKHGEGIGIRLIVAFESLLIQSIMDISMRVAFLVCPANWDPKTNAATIKPSPKESLDYFSKNN